MDIQIQKAQKTASKINPKNITSKYIIIKMSKVKKKKEFLKNEDSLRNLWDNIRHTNICITGALEGEEREKGRKGIWRHNS